MNRNNMLHEEDPHNISSSVATQPAPSIEELLQSQNKYQYVQILIH